MGGRGSAGGATAAGTQSVRDDNRIRAAYRAVARPGEFVSLADVRDRLTGMSRVDQDAALRRMVRTNDANVAPNDYQYRLTSRDRAAALDFGGRRNHLIWIGDPSPRRGAS